MAAVCCHFDLMQTTAKSNHLRKRHDSSYALGSLAVSSLAFYAQDKILLDFTVRPRLQGNVLSPPKQLSRKSGFVTVFLAAITLNI